MRNEEWSTLNGYAPSGIRLSKHDVPMVFDDFLARFSGLYSLRQAPLSLGFAYEANRDPPRRGLVRFRRPRHVQQPENRSKQLHLMKNEE